MKIQGKVKEILKPETFKSKKGTEFTKQTLLLTIGDTYPEHVPIEFFQDKIALLKNLNADQEIVAHINLKSREYNGKYYVSINGWKIDTDVQLEGHNAFAVADKSNKYTDLPF